MFGLKGPELLIILLIVVLIFGARKLPDLARSIGASAKEFRKGIEQGDDEADSQMSDASEAPTSATTEAPTSETTETSDS